MEEEKEEGISENTTDLSRNTSKEQHLVREFAYFDASSKFQNKGKGNGNYQIGGFFEHNGVSFTKRVQAKSTFNAEFLALLELLDRVHTLPKIPTQLLIRGDNYQVIAEMKGEKIPESKRSPKKPGYFTKIANKKIRNLKKKGVSKVQFEWRKREKNKRADQISRGKHRK